MGGGVSKSSQSSRLIREKKLSQLYLYRCNIPKPLRFPSTTTEFGEFGPFPGGDRQLRGSQAIRNGVIKRGWEIRTKWDL